MHTTINPSGVEPPSNPPLAPAASPASRTAPRRRRQKRRWPIVAVVVVLLAAGGWWWWRRAKAPAATAPGSSTELVTVTRGTVEKSVDSSGKVVSNLDVEIKCRASGEIIKLPFDISQSVKKGDLLCQLDPTDEQLAVRSADAAVAQSAVKVAQAKFDLEQAEQNLVTTRHKDESELASAKVKARNLRAKADRQKQLVQQQLGSPEDLETAQTEAASAEAAMQSAEIAIEELKQQQIQVEYKREAIKTAEAQLQADQVTLEIQKQQLAYTTVTAPIDGVLSALNVQKGAIVASGMSGFSGGTTILTLSDLSHVFVTATVDESDIGQVQVGQAARITVASFLDRTFVGRVTRIATKGVNSSNVVTFEVKVEVLDEHKDLLRPEMTGNVRIVQAERANVLTLPADAVTHENGNTFVTMSDGKRRAVTLGLQGEDYVEILSGVNEGDRVFVSTAELPTKWNTEDRKGKGPPPR
ncbi:MAG TPA: efflux RND transporter periplasmic adaptor subunit [Tepidisphaeraceae bacterium]|jgi:HlyD family secretion protein|nr:efflux RND transporter periplasmic adaptor subunit [Tepidisphaeraceae bacterium]